MKSRFGLLALMLLVLSGCSEMRLGAEAVKGGLPQGDELGTYKVGKPYQIDGNWYFPQESYSYDETGVASWYGPGFHGKRTANGERFNTGEMTAAHRTLQMPSFVRVTNLDNGRSVVVRINDRGPYARGRIIDVSQKAAELLDFKRNGTAKVRVTVLPEESRQVAMAAQQGKRWHGDVPAPTAAPARAAVQTAALNDPVPVENGTPVPVHVKAGEYYPDPVVNQLPVAAQRNLYIQAGSFSTAENANRLSATLAKLGRASVTTAVVNGQTFHRVRVGPLASVPEADQILGRVVAAGAKEARIIVD